MKIEVFLGQTNAANHVVFKKGNMAKVFSGDSNGMFDEMVNLYSDSVATKLAEHIGNGENINMFESLPCDECEFSEVKNEMELTLICEYVE